MNYQDPTHIRNIGQPHTARRVTSPACMSCNLNNVCLPSVLSDNQVPAFEGIIDSEGALEKGQHLFHDREEFNALYIVRSGAVKTYIAHAGGTEHVTGFHLPGDIIGLENRNVSHHQYAAVALERTTLCAISAAQFDNLILEIPALRVHLYTLMSLKIKESQHLSIMIGHYVAEQRVIYFLLSLSSHYRRRNLSPIRFRFPISRTEIARYLGLAKETVSRSLHQLTKKKLITIDGREINLLDTDRLAHHLNRVSP